MPPDDEASQAGMWQDSYMRTITLVSCFALFAVAGCDDGGGDKDRQPRDADASATITSGSYEISSFDVHKDGCDLNYSASDFNGNVINVTVTGNSADLNGLVISFSNGVVSGSEVQTGEDVLGDGSCLVDITTSDEGTIPANDEIDLVESLEVSNPVGDCSPVPVDLPCESRYFARLTKQ